MLIINLGDRDTATFAQGDEIEGDVIYPGAQPTAPFRLVVEFVGVVKTKASRPSGSSHKTVHEEAEIVRLLVSDAQWNCTVIPFSFRIPQSAPPLERDPTPPTGQVGEGWVPTPLPPSHEIRGGVDKKFLRVWAGSTEYKVRATIFPQDTSALLQQEVAINYSPRSDARPSHEKGDGSDHGTDCVKDISVKSLLLLPENKDRKLTFGEKTKSLFQWSSLPTFNFKVITTHPSRVSLGEPLHFVVKLELSPDTSTAPATSEITLVNFAHMVQGESEVWAEGTQNLVPSAEAAFCSSNSNLGPFQPSRDYAKTISTPVFTHALPSFRIKNASRSYSIMSTVRVECAGKAFWWENRSDLTVLPAMWGVVLPDEPLLKWSFTKYPAVEWKEGGLTQKHQGVTPEQLALKPEKGDETQEHWGFSSTS